MADVAQGPGWWIASDGQWYPPELHPSRMPPPQWGAPPQVIESTPRTNGLAIASLVLSLTVFLIGPVLAIIFGAIARRQIRESRGGQSGDGLALAGLIVGIVELAISLVVVALVIVLAANGSFSRLGQRELSISGAPGYTTTTGDSGRTLADGSPWGRPCQPIVFQVNSKMPSEQYALIAQSVAGARALGLDVTVETQNLLWYPALLYPAGQTNATVQVVTIFPSTATPPTLPDGHAERIGFGWDTKISPDGHHDVLTDFQATLYLGSVRGDAQATERATRQMIAYTQGVADSTSPGSSISMGNTQEAYSQQDLAAMHRMSGCTFQPTTHPGPSTS
jgi:Domain of unknown function (DUF4190)